MNARAAKGSKKAKPAISTHKKPAGLSEADWQRELRKQAVPAAKDKVTAFRIGFLGGEHPVFGDYSVENPTSGGRYKVALRTARPESPNFCSCPDFRTNLLGTCKHIEAVLAFVRKNSKLSKLLKGAYNPAYSSLYIKYGKYDDPDDYGSRRQVRLRIGEDEDKRAAYQRLAKHYFDDSLTLLPNAFDSINQLLADAAAISPDFRCYPDVLDFIIKQREDRKRQALIKSTVTDTYLDNLLKATLYPYQKEGILFAARAGRCLIADDMGLGKTIQAIGSAEFFRKACGASSVLVICPTSLKYQWKSEIEKFTDSSTLVIEGDPPKRKLQYQRSDAVYKIISYHAAQTDLDEIRKLRPDLVILDEAQRIKNWQTKTAQAVKKIESTYAIVLTGTPIENKLEELYSIIQFVDPYRLGPLYHFLSEYQIQDESGKVVGYRDLNQIQELLRDVVIRRTKQSVLSQLPERTDKHLFVPLTEQQSDIHAEYADNVARLVHKWRQFGFLDEQDRLRLMLALNCMRMVADSTFILDQETRYDTKIDELMYILDDVLAAREAADRQKVVVFSQWERMTRLVRAELDARQVGYAYLHGGVPSHKRAGLLDDFRDDPDCRIFLSTDAGGVGLNLQSASLMVNLDIPWNPAVLEQRIGRIHRHGQKRAVNIINLVSRESIEERLLDILAFKSSLFAGVLDNGSDQIFMGESKFNKFMRSVEEVAGTAGSDSPAGQADSEKRPQPKDSTQNYDDSKAAKGTDEPAARFLSAAGNFFDTLSKTLADPAATQNLVASLTEKDQTTGQTYLKVPVQNEQLVKSALDAFTGLLSTLKRP